MKAQRNIAVTVLHSLVEHLSVIPVRKHMQPFFRMMDRLPDWLLLLILPFKILYYFIEALVFELVPDYFRKKETFLERIVVITGGGSGIGRCLALGMGKLGAKVVIWDIDLTKAETVQAQIVNDGGEAYVYRCDIADRYQVYLMADMVRKDVGEPSILINCAGIGV